MKAKSSFTTGNVEKIGACFIEICLRITSGKIQADVKVSYRDFYDQLENCKFALTDCKYNLEII